MQTPAQIKFDSLAYARIDAAAHEAATGHNLRPLPSRAQQRAGNFKKGRALLHGMQLVIEHPRGTYRCGVSTDGMAWSSRVAAHYGYLAGTRGADGQPVDVLVGPFPESEVAWVINQRRPDGSFDEHKVMLGFHTEDQARAAYTDSYAPGWTGLQSIVAIGPDELREWLRTGPRGALTLEQLSNQGLTMDHVNRALAGQSAIFSPNRWMYALRAADVEDGLLLDAATMDELMQAPEWDGHPVLDALVVEVGRLQPKMDALLRVMQLAGQTVKPVSVSLSEPVRARGVLNVMALFLMDDGQTVSLWLHNPDTTPSRLAPMDELISWKWMLNKRDVTIVVAPERGVELDAREVARRLMLLVAKNSAAFRKANEKAAERAEQMRALDAEIVQLTDELGELQHRIEVARVAFADRPKQALAPIEPGTPDFVAWEDAVTVAVVAGLGLSRSDAQSLMELKSAELREAFDAGVSADNAARLVTGANEEGGPEASTSDDPSNDAGDATAPAPIASPGDEELERQAMAGHEVHGIAHNLALPARERAGLPLATLGSIFLYTEEDRLRAAKAVEDAETQRDFKPFDASKVRMPSAAQLGATKDYVATVLTRNDGLAMATGWSNGFILDLHQMPRFIETAMKRRLGDLLNPGARVRRYDKVEVTNRFMPKALANATARADPLALWDGTITEDKKGKPVTTARPCVVLVDEARAGAYVAVQLPFFAYFFKTYPGCEFYIGTESDMVLVRHRGEVVGIVMPFNFKNRGNVFARAVRAASTAATADPVAAVDAAYRFASATPEFKRVVAETIDKADYSAFVTARDMDREATRRGLFIDWDVASDSVFDAVGMLALWPQALLDAVAAVGGDLVGTIYRGADIVGRAEIASGDGKAMVFVGEAGDERVYFRSEVDGTLLKALWSDDDAPLMIGWLDDMLNGSRDGLRTAERAANEVEVQAGSLVELQSEAEDVARSPADLAEPPAQSEQAAQSAQAEQSQVTRPPAPDKDDAMELDRAYLHSFVDGSADVLADDILARIEPLVGKYEGHPEMGPLLSQAMDAYSAQVMQMAQHAIQ